MKYRSASGTQIHCTVGTSPVAVSSSLNEHITMELHDCVEA
jgi:hypothetical protein